jgi:hypothetical protein
MPRNPGKGGSKKEKKLAQKNNDWRNSRSDNEEVEKENEKPVETIQVKYTSNSSNAVSTSVSTCQQMGIADTLKDQHNHYKRVTKNWGWKYFKLITEEDYHISSKFSHFMCEKLLRDPDEECTKSWWNQIKGTVQRAMQDIRSTCTQAMKRVFLGK